MPSLSIVSCVAGTAVLAAISRRSLLHPRSHGFCRFFAWEGILLLVLLNVPFWFDDPFSLPQILSWIVLTAALYVVIHGVLLLHSRGKPGTREAVGADLAFERTTALVTTGIYRYLRHPLYASLLYLTWGVFLKRISWATIGLAVAVSLFLYATARTEEKENAIHFGNDYVQYAAKTKMFIPYIW